MYLAEMLLLSFVVSLTLYFQNFIELRVLKLINILLMMPL